MIENKIANRVSALNRERVVVPGIQQGGVFGRDEVTSCLVGPELEKCADVKNLFIIDYKC